ncbi:MAG: hypothetical protein QM741_00805 [Rudaea sp.]|uniref:hypothetical protein n=1 Tax=Rudaea sp. TaxID=2136325 RepID=UPI0039E564C6
MTDIEVKNWVELAVLPAVDLCQWAKWKHSEINQFKALVSKFFATSSKDVRSDRIKKMMREWLSWETHRRLMLAQPPVKEGSISLSTGLKTSMLKAVLSDQN